MNPYTLNLSAFRPQNKIKAPQGHVLYVFQENIAVDISAVTYYDIHIVFRAKCKNQNHYYFSMTSKASNFSSENCGKNDKAFKISCCLENRICWITSGRVNKQERKRTNERVSKRTNERTREEANERTNERERKQTKERESKRTKERTREEANERTRERVSERTNERTSEQPN